MSYLNKGPMSNKTQSVNLENFIKYCMPDITDEIYYKLEIQKLIWKKICAYSEKYLLTQQCFCWFEDRILLLFGKKNV